MQVVLGRVSAEIRFEKIHFSRVIFFTALGPVVAGWMPLHIAARYGTLEIVQLIFEHIQESDPLIIYEVTRLCLLCRDSNSNIGKAAFFQHFLACGALRERVGQAVMVMFGNFAFLFLQ